VGDDARFMCNSKKIISWTYIDKQLPKNGYFAGPYLRTLILRNVNPTNTGVYRCQYKDNNGKVVVDSASLLVVGMALDI